jgi:WD40 repeat protein
VSKVATGRLLRLWPGHYKTVTCLVFSDDDSLLISGADDGLINVWPLLRFVTLSSQILAVLIYTVPYFVVVVHEA